MFIDMIELQARFGSYLWNRCRRFRGRGFDPEDIYQDVLLEAAKESFRVKPTRCRDSGDSLPYDPADVQRFMRCLVIDRLDYYARRCRVIDPQRLPDNSGSMEPRGFDALIRNVRDALDGLEQEIFDQIVYPDLLTWKIAKDEQDEARADTTRLRMNIHNELQVKGKHIAQRLGISPATMSRRLKTVHRAVSDAMSWIGPA